jgi:cytochrome P450
VSCREVAELLAKEIVFLIFAGTDTTAYTFTRLMQFLAKYPEWLQALTDEQAALVAEFGPDISQQVCKRHPLRPCMRHSPPSIGSSCHSTKSVAQNPHEEHAPHACNMRSMC